MVDASFWKQLGASFSGIRGAAGPQFVSFITHPKTTKIDPSITRDTFNTTAGEWNVVGLDLFKEYACHAAAALGPPLNSRLDLVSRWLDYLAVHTDALRATGDCTDTRVTPSIYAFTYGIDDVCAVSARCCVTLETEAVRRQLQRIPLAETIEKLRNEKGWGYEKLALESGIDKKAILSHVNDGVIPWAQTLKKYADTFGTTVEELKSGKPK